MIAFLNAYSALFTCGPQKNGIFEAIFRPRGGRSPEELLTLNDRCANINSKPVIVCTIPSQVVLQSGEEIGQNESAEPGSPRFIPQKG
jgi:hypothetical protein